MRMHKRLSGNRTILEDDEGNVLLVTTVAGNTLTLRQGNWITIKERVADPQHTLARFAPGGARGSRYRFFDVDLDVYSNIPEILDDFGRTYRRFAVESHDLPDISMYALSTGLASPRSHVLIMQPATDRALRLKGDFCPVSYLSSFEHLLFQVHSEAEVFVLTNNPHHTFIHGGAVEKDGIGYVLPAESKQGKTTLTMALVDAGYSFLSDEFAVLDMSGSLLPFPRALSVRADSLSLFPKLDRRRKRLPTLYSPVDTLYSIDLLSALSPRVGRRCRIGYVIFPRYDPSEKPSIRAISRMDTVQRLVGTKTCISLGTAEKQSAIDLLLSTIRDVECFELVTGDLHETVELVDRLGSDRG